MKNSSTQNKYKEGQVVHAKADPETKLVITRYLDRIYYCEHQKNPSRNNLVFFERELEVHE